MVFLLILQNVKLFRHVVRLFFVTSLKQLLPHLDILKFFSFKWPAIVDLHCIQARHSSFFDKFIQEKSHITLRSSLLALEGVC